MKKLTEKQKRELFENIKNYITSDLIECNGVRTFTNLIPFISFEKFIDELVKNEKFLDLMSEYFKERNDIRYFVGDEVYCIYKNKVVKAKIKAIIIRDDIIEYELEYAEEIFKRNENEIGKTKEELFSKL